MGKGVGFLVCHALRGWRDVFSGFVYPSFCFGIPVGIFPLSLLQVHVDASYSGLYDGTGRLGEELRAPSGVGDCAVGFVFFREREICPAVFVRYTGSACFYVAECLFGMDRIFRLISLPCTTVGFRVVGSGLVVL